jgi:ABC-type sugar transport system ATPase subunit
MLDEPTAALGVVQTKQVLDLMRRLRDRGLAVMMISHNLNDVFEVADRIAVLHLGRMVIEDVISAFDRQTVVEYMTFGGQRHAAVASVADREGSDRGPN